MKTILITGASDGIGAAAARALAGLGHTVILTGRDRRKTSLIAGELGADFFIADFAKLTDVKALAEKILQTYSHIDVLVHNAGLIARNERVTTGDGFELTFQVNHLAPFLLNSLLSPLLSASRSRIIITSSRAHLQGKLNFEDLQLTKNYTPYKAYANSKLMNVVFAHELAERYGSVGIESASFHPGVVTTRFGLDSDGLTGKIYRSIVQRFMRSPEKGAETLVWLAETSELKNGAYYFDKAIAKQHPSAFDPQLGRRLWDETFSLLD